MNGNLHNISKPTAPEKPFSPAKREVRNWCNTIASFIFLLASICLLLYSFTTILKDFFFFLFALVLSFIAFLTFIIASSKKLVPASKEDEREFEKAQEEYRASFKKYQKDAEDYIHSIRDYANAGIPITSDNSYEIIEDQQPPYPLYTIYRLGPEFLTYCYPVDTDPYKEIYKEDGLIGPDKYRSYPGALEALEENDNTWFIDDDKKEVLELLIHDLKILAEKHGMDGAYSLLASVSSYFTDRKKYLELGLAKGNVPCMVAYAITLYTQGRTSDGFSLLKKGADAGDKLACLLVAITYHYGTISPIDLNKAAEYYTKALGDEYEFYIYLNLGSMLVASGYYHTALRYFERMKEASEKDTKELQSYGYYEEYLSNINTCKELLEFPYAERVKRTVLQEHSRRLDSIFCENHKSLEPFVPEYISGSTEKWIPDPELIEVDPLDIEEQETMSQDLMIRQADKTEDFLFLSIPIKIEDPQIFGTQQELIFLEKECHAELNKYIQANLVSLRATFKSIGYLFVYLPSHLQDLIDQTDRIGSYHNDYGDSVWKNLINDFGKHKTTEYEYWRSMVPNRQLPEDCAGFLRYVPNLNNLEDHSNFEYILFPYRPGTDWSRAFREFVGLMRNKPIVPIRNKPEPKKFLPAGSILDITPEFDFFLKDNCDQILASIKMPTLSKVILLALLNHPEGIVIKCMIDYRDELWTYYQAIAGNKAKIENIETLCDPTNNSIYEKISRIKSAFTSALEEKYPEELTSFVPVGKRGEGYHISLDRGRIKDRSKTITSLIDK